MGRKDKGAFVKNRAAFTVCPLLQEQQEDLEGVFSDMLGKFQTYRKVEGILVNIYT